MLTPGPIGVFDSGYGGLTILTKLQEILPQYDYCYLGDNSRAPYGSRSFDIVYQFTREAVFKLFDEGCNLVILACNTASAKALRTIQQKDLVNYPGRRVLGVIRPTAEVIGAITQSRHVGVLGTIGTVASNSYAIEIKKLHPDVSVVSQACPMWVPLVENNEFDNDGADYFIQKYIDAILQTDDKIDSLILGCTHYPILMDKIQKYLPKHVQLVSQGEYVATSLQDYLQRHAEIDIVCTKGGKTKYYTTESAEKFAKAATIFLGRDIETENISI